MYDLLSDAMYSNKPRAVVREILCNAWDSHIATGRTNIPIKVTIDNDKMVIRDYGSGIPHDKIHQIYCVYGKSTKENDGLQTGGFGLGSKAPFAYSHHFTITNHMDGLKVVHAISRGSAATKGKPDRRVMVSVPSLEQGVEVMVPIKNNYDARIFIGLVQEIAAYGEMYVELNGIPVSTIPISQAEGNMFLTCEDITGSTETMFVRYGNVVYPIPEHEDYNGEKLILQQELNKVKSQDDYIRTAWKIILQASPNSIAVTPSRESLSMTELTIGTIKSLINDVNKYFDISSKIFEDYLIEEENRLIDLLWLQAKPHTILTTKSLKRAFDNEGSYPKWIMNLKELANYYLRKTNPDYSRGIWKKLRLNRIQKMIDAGWHRPWDLIQTIKGEQASEPSYRYYAKSIHRHLIKQVAKIPELNPKLLCVASQQTVYKRQHAFTSLAKYAVNLEEQMMLDVGIVVISYSKTDYSEYFNELNPLFSENHARYFYYPGRAKGHKEIAIEFFTKAGFFVIDFAEQMAAYRALHKPIPEEKSVKEPLQGLIALNALRVRNNFDRKGHLNQNNPPRLLNFDYVIRPYSLNGYSPRFFPWYDGSAIDIIDKFGDKIAICTNSKQMESYIKKGKKDGIIYIVETVVNKVLTTPSIRTYFESKADNATTNVLISQLMQLGDVSPVIKAALNLPSGVSEDDMTWITIYNILKDNIRYESGDWVKLIQDAEKTIITWNKAPYISHLEKLVKNNKRFSVLKVADIITMLRNNPNNLKLRIFLETTIITALQP